MAAIIEEALAETLGPPDIVEQVKSALGMAEKLGDQAEAASSRFSAKRGERASDLVEAIDGIDPELRTLIEALEARVEALTSAVELLQEIREAADEVAGMSEDYSITDAEDRPEYRESIAEQLEQIGNRLADWDESWLTLIEAVADEDC